jgi:cytochrome c553
MIYQRLLLILLGFLASSFLLSSCGSGEENDKEVFGKNVNPLGLQVMTTNCATCHSPDASMDNRLAPPMFAVKKHYVDEETSLEDFKADIMSFLVNPSEANSKMPGAVKKFGIMPKLAYTEEQMDAVAEYIFYTDLEKPDWFDEHYLEEHGNETVNVGMESMEPIDQGLKYAMATKAVLGKNLMGQINSHGTAGALSFCSTRAIHLTDSMGNAQNVKVKRVSDKPRNPDNMASGAELDYILEQKQVLAQGAEMRAEIHESDGNWIGYYPITTNAMCLQCHGQVGENIKPEIDTQIKEIYPADKATGYGENELRGIWVVQF